MDYNILNLIKHDIDFSKTETIKGEKSPSMSLLIKFNIPLNPHLLDNDSAFITDSHGDFIHSSVKYDRAQNAVKLITRSDWHEGAYYFLNIGGNIKSLSGHSLSGRVTFRFRIKEGKPTEFLLVSGKTSLGANRVNSNIKKAEVQIIDKLPIKKKKESSKTNDHLTYILNIPLIVMFLTSVVFLVLTFMLKNSTLFYLGIISSLLFSVFLLAYLIGHKGKSRIHYNLGTFFYNIKKYEKSVYHFEKSLYYDTKNVQSRLALDLAFSQYLNKI